MKADGSTLGGCWIYTGVYADGVNQAARKKSRHEQSFVAPEWGWAWPMNRRILYNRASAAACDETWVPPFGFPLASRRTPPARPRSPQPTYAHPTGPAPLWSYAPRSEEHTYE